MEFEAKTRGWLPWWAVLLTFWFAVLQPCPASAIESDPRSPLPATRSYQYDALYRLTGETISGDANGNDGTVTYTLDKVGNRTGRSASGLLATRYPLPATTSSYNARDWLDSDTYDANGNTLTSPSLATHSPLLATFTDIYDFEDRLIIRQRQDGSSVNLTYDADGNRIGKIVISGAGEVIRATTWLVDTNNLTGYSQVLEERTTTGTGPAVVTTFQTYTYGSDLLSRSVLSSSASPSLAFFSYDGHGSVRELTDENGTITDRYDYDAFGLLIASTGSTANAYLYCSEQFDPDLALYFLRARFMNPDSGRFWNMDTYEGSAEDAASLHKYLYASTNPVTYVDPTGHMTMVEISTGSAVRGIVFTIAVVSVYSFTQSFNDVSGGLADASDALGRAATGLAMSAAAAAFFQYESLHDQVEKGIKDMANELKERLRRLKVVPISFTIMPNVAQHVQDAQGGPFRPQLLTHTTSVRAKQNRRDAIAGRGPAGAEMSWDEYPFASTTQGGFGASVRPVPLRENLVQGGVIAASYAIQGIKPGDEFIAVVIP